MKDFPSENKPQNLNALLGNAVDKIVADVKITDVFEQVPLEGKPISARYKELTGRSFFADNDVRREVGKEGDEVFYELKQDYLASCVMVNGIPAGIKLWKRKTQSP